MSEERELPSPVRKAKNEYYRSIFEKYDKDSSGNIDLNELVEMLKSDDDIPRSIIKNVFKISDSNGDDKINYEEFVGMVENKKFKDIFGHYVDLYIRYILPPKHRSLVDQDVTDGGYEDHYSCWPPPLAMVLISALECACFLTDEMAEGSIRGPIAEALIYDPYKRLEVWRFLTYMFVHVGYTHLVVNLTVQLLLGIFLEMVHKWWRVLAVYFLGVVAGSLATSITDPTSYLAGASGGVYAILTAHIASIILNWKEMTFPLIQLMIFFIISGVDIGMSIYNRYWLEKYDRIGYAAHFAGAIAGLLVGIWVLKNFVPTKRETYIWWCALILSIVLLGTMVVLNISWKKLFFPYMTGI